MSRKLTKDQTNGFSKIIKKGMEHYRVVPHSLGYLEEKNISGIVGYVVWHDPEAHFTTQDGFTNQEFYIKESGEVVTLKNDIFTPVNFRAKTWETFCYPKKEQGGE